MGLVVNCISLYAFPYDYFKKTAARITLKVDVAIIFHSKIKMTGSQSG